MTTQPATAAKKKLLARRKAIEHLRKETEVDTTSLRDASDGQSRERAADLTNVLVRLSEREWAELAELDAALARIEAGTWGTCVKCSRSIGRQRLVAQPQARTCIACEN